MIAAVGVDLHHAVEPVQQPGGDSLHAGRARQLHRTALFGILIVDYYLVKRQKIVLDDLYTVAPTGSYWYRNGVNHRAVAALLPAALIAVLCVMVPSLDGMANFSWFIGAGLGALFYRLLAR